MSTTQVGDRVRAHYTKRLANGVVRSSRSAGRPPVELTVGSPHPRLPGLGTRLVGLSVGETVTAHVPAAEAYGVHDPARVRRFDRARFPADEPLVPGGQARMRLGGGRTRPVRVVEVLGREVVVDTNHPWCGQSVELEVELVAILAPADTGA